jgi:hypothetical protein
MAVVLKSFAAAAVAVVVSSVAFAQDRVAVGTLTCDVSAGFGLIIGSQRSVNCTLAPAVPGPVEYYGGTITKVGVDIGVTSSAVMVWLVYAPTNRPIGALQGNYVGATGEATFVVGLGANVLVGGSNRSVALQPVSIQGQTGFNVAGGVAELALRFNR